MTKTDPVQLVIEGVLAKWECPAEVRRVNRGYTLVHEDRAIARIRPLGKEWEVAWWSHRDKWEPIGDFGGVFFGTVEEAVRYVLEDPMGIFW